MSTTQMMNQISTLTREHDDLVALLERAVNPKLKEAIDREIKTISKQADKLAKKMRDAK